MTKRQFNLSDVERVSDGDRLMIQLLFGISDEHYNAVAYVEAARQYMRRAAGYYDGRLPTPAEITLDELHTEAIKRTEQTELGALLDQLCKS